MNPPFYRACRKHREELQDKTEGTVGHEVLWCSRGGLEGKGHRCRSWLVLDNVGDTLAIGHLNESPQLISGELARIDFAIPAPPEKFCKRGHYEWYLDTDGRYRCRICRRDRMFKKYYEQPKPEPKAKKSPRIRRKLKHKIIAPFRHGRQRFN